MTTLESSREPKKKRHSSPRMLEILSQTVERRTFSRTSRKFLWNQQQNMCHRHQRSGNQQRTRFCSLRVTKTLLSAMVVDSRPCGSWMHRKLFPRRRKKPKEWSRIVANVSEIFVLRCLEQLSTSIDNFLNKSTGSIYWSQGRLPRAVYRHLNLDMLPLSSTAATTSQYRRRAEYKVFRRRRNGKNRRVAIGVSRIIVSWYLGYVYSISKGP